ncbi:hypothetical protein AAZX31_17G118100 [Glycine max]|uniref:CLE20 protein n=2 Tax=Glycine subgen. Soja TaxID=1462606 RepID=E9L566_SOYBN|nr:CLAVATA3/ESR (CLE)-related protein 13 [Glycine max]XP_028210143.1 CLAVATA3/ESR (CLE)-related protein 13-like [Glycine soja]ADW77274.1 CLE20 protein [Glycine max]KAG4930231.1 hypothetical protein JHK86_047192 [Glycine max]KAG4932992.1 hypothetical protein JHK87_046994 [Glycine soja]KAG5097445.1 hypothetical protein JHK82_047299 [Glycine max]KAG5102232.1 hypothetical protein JHK84_047201 [Glycine max]|eukprot:XP_014624969.1 CLAVATA3/ESR (CLE)-related protein 13 [Glycine max]
MAMIIRFQHPLSFILWLFLFLVLFQYVWFGSKSNNDNNAVFTNNQLQFSLSRNRRILTTGRGFDFTPFLHHHHRGHHRRHHHRSRVPESKETEIDPRYGVEKRLVPTGPNPLHH